MANTPPPPRFVVGLATNAEIVFTFDGNRNDEKLPLEDFSIQLSGSSSDVAIGLSKLGHNARLIGLIAESADDQSALLNIAVKKHSIPHLLVPALDHTSVAVLPGDISGKNRIVGKRGEILNHTLETAARLIGEASAATEWRIATGARTREFPLISTLLGENPGRRVLNPNLFLCRERTAFKNIISYADILVMNKNEEAACGMSFLELHAAGPHLVIVTEGERGGRYSLGGIVGRFYAIPPVSETLFLAGAGDWFLAGFLASCVRVSFSAFEGNEHLLHQCLEFGARVAAKKITMPGAGNGPSLDEL